MTDEQRGQVIKALNQQGYTFWEAPKSNKK